MRKMKKRTKAKFLSILTIVMVLVCGMSCLGIFYVNSALTDELDYVIHAYDYAKTFGDASGYLTDEVRAYAATGDRKHYDNYWYEVNTAKNRDNSVEAMHALGISQTESDLIDKVYSLSDGLIPIEEQAMEYTMAGNTAGALGLLYGAEYKAGVEEITATLKSLNNAVVERVEAEEAKLVTMMGILTVLSAISVITTLAAQIVVVLFVMRELIQPILKVRDKVGELAQGDLDGAFDVEEDDTEIGETARSMKEFQSFQKELIEDIDYLLSEMANGNFCIRTRCEESYRGSYANILVSLRKINRTLSNTLAKINDAANLVDSGAIQISAGAQSLAQSTTEQASSVEELYATVMEISNRVQGTAQDSQSANHQMDEVGNKVTECNQQMQDMIAAMDNINESSAEISKVIKTIEDIAFQTNILALNAAVEAARAGAAGKGFAVVADEVRSLAAKSAEASQTTSSLINNSQTAVKRGMDMANQTAVTLEQVVSIAQQSSEIVAKIAMAAEEESESIKQVTEGIDQISGAIQINSATSEESAATSQELTNHAQNMKELISAFKLRTN
ncbi:MAG: HAMP domain-containing protein [Lachnospiraceae bacterium]|nr:HAMP domain-containing protein [Lachnospiraceae bacterium]